jgi:hypothetical protein
MKNQNSVRGTARSDFVSTERPDRLGAHSAGTPGVKRPGHEVENLARHLALVKNEHLCSNTHLHGVVLTEAQEGLFFHFDTCTVRQNGTDHKQA